MYGRDEKKYSENFFHSISPGVEDQQMSYIRTVIYHSPWADAQKQRRWKKFPFHSKTN